MIRNTDFYAAFRGIKTGMSPRPCVVTTGDDGPERLDPSANDIVTTKGGIDATQPVDRRSFPKRITIPESVTSRIKLEDYLTPEVLKQL